MALTFLIGGARSGKSTMALRLASAFAGPVAVIATAEARDDDMAGRIAEHRAARPSTWTTIEEPLDLARAVDAVGEGTFVLLDCLTLWVSNALEAGRPDGELVAEAAALASTLAARRTPSVVVSNEVGLGIVPANALARRYRDLLGRVNAAVAAVADRSFLVVAGRGVALDGPDLP